MREDAVERGEHAARIAGAVELLRSVADDLLRPVEPAITYRLDETLAAAPPAPAAAAHEPGGAACELALLGLREAAALVRAREVSPVELVRACLAQADVWEPSIRSLVARADERALGQARRAEREIASGLYDGELHGIPITVKDIVDAAGWPTAAGSPPFAAVPDASARVVARLEARGAIVLAKANTHQFAWGGTTPPTRNPWDTARIPGGSSGGSAASLAAGIGYGSVGSDTAGSVRSPASYNGVVGLKATHGRFPAQGVVPLAWTLDAAGPLARRVADVALLADAMAGAAAATAVDGGVRGLRVGIIEDYFFSPIQADVDAATRRAIAALADAGATVESVELPGELLELSLAVAFVLIVAESAAWHRSWLRIREELYAPDVLAYMRAADGITAVDYLDAQRVRRLLQESVEAALARVDLLAMPSHPQVAPRVDEQLVVFGDGRTLHRDAAGVHNLAIFNLTGHPAVSVPAGLAGGMPIGLQLVGRHHEDATVLRGARAVERAVGPLRPPRVVTGAPARVYNRHP